LPGRQVPGARLHVCLPYKGSHACLCGPVAGPDTHPGRLCPGWLYATAIPLPMLQAAAAGPGPLDQVGMSQWAHLRRCADSPDAAWQQVGPLVSRAWRRPACRPFPAGSSSCMPPARVQLQPRRRHAAALFPPAPSSQASSSPHPSPPNRLRQPPATSVCPLARGTVGFLWPLIAARSPASAPSPSPMPADGEFCARALRDVPVLRSHCGPAGGRRGGRAAGGGGGCRRRARARPRQRAGQRGGRQPGWQ
jgi:hypothetical protein